MRKCTRFISVIGLFLMLGAAVPAIEAQQPRDWTSRLSTIPDQSLRRTLENSIAAGLISDEADFDTAVTRAESRFVSQNPTALYAVRGKGDTGNTQSIRDAIAKSSAPLAKLDRDAVDAKKVDGTRGKLFLPLTGSLPASYEAAYKLALLFNPRVGTNDSERLNSQIDAFLASIADDPVIKQALQSTGTKMADLKRNWFGAGAGFEHVICGEINGSEVSGYHWWYKFYRDEQTGNTEYISTLENAGSDYAYTGAFTWDPDGSGPMPNAKKKKGGFAVGNSVQAILALGHIAIESARKFGSIPGALSFDADVNGQTFTWQLYTMGGTIRSLYPMGGKGNMPEPGDIVREYYSLESEALQGVNAEASLTVH